MTGKPTLGITRIDLPSKKTFGYMVRLRRGGHAVHEFFSDTKYRGKKRAEKAARSHYQEIVAISRPPNTAHKNVLTARNKSGKVGVRISVNRGRGKSKTDYASWAASWVGKNGQRHTVSFAWNKYGKKIAFALAVLARENEWTDREQILALHAS